MIKKKLLTHALKNGQKQISEKIFLKSLKFVQKHQKKSHSEIIKLLLTNIAPIFKIVKLKNKNRKKNFVKEIPTFLSNYDYRISWGIKYFMEISTSKQSIYNQLQFEILSNLSREGNTVKFKNKLQNETLVKKKYFKYYRW